MALALSEEARVVYQQRVEEFLPNIRYCSYNIGDESALGDLMQMRLASGKAGGEEFLSSNIDVRYETLHYIFENQKAIAVNVFNIVIVKLD